MKNEMDKLRQENIELKAQVGKIEDQRQKLTEGYKHYKEVYEAQSSILYYECKKA